MGNTCHAQSGVMGVKEAEKPEKFIAVDKNAFSIISCPVAAEPKSTRGFPSRKVRVRCDFLPGWEMLMFVRIYVTLRLLRTVSL